MDRTLLDTDILSEVLKKKDARVLKTASEYLTKQQRLSFSAITYYEVVRGLRANKATRGLTNFLAGLSGFDILEISIPILRRAADLWVDARNGGHPRDDADLIIAATALESGLTLATGNTAHFEWIPDLELADWRAGK